MIQRWCRDHIT